MKNLLKETGKQIRQGIILFHPPFRKFVSVQIFLYGTTGVANVLFDWTLYFLAYNFLFQKEDFCLGFWTLSPHVAALVLTFPISFSSGFLLQKYVTFAASTLHGQTQIMRYLLVVALNFLINYAGLKLFVEVFHFFPTPSKMIITGITVVISYLFQKKFTFKV